MSRSRRPYLNDDTLYPLLERYLAGSASAVEAETVRAWLAADVEHPQVLDEIRLIRRVAGERPPESDVDAAWARAVQELGLGEPPGTTATDGAVLRRMPGRPLAEELVPRASRTRRFSVSAAWLSAAVVVAAVGGGLLWQLRHPLAGTVGDLVWRDDEYVTHRGQRSEVALTDGTRLTLAPESRLRIAADFGTTRRDVHLVGKAYFDVEHDAGRPFRVHTRDGVAEDLGTAFLVRAYPEQTATEVVVAEGRVALRGVEPAGAPGAGTATLLLSVGDLGRLDGRGHAAVLHGVEVDRHLAWTAGILAFDDTSLAQVVATLERWYGVEIRLEDGGFAARRLTARFDDEPVSQVLQRIALTLDLRVEQRDEWFVLSGR